MITSSNRIALAKTIIAMSHRIMWKYFKYTMCCAYWSHFSGNTWDIVISFVHHNQHIIWPVPQEKTLLCVAKQWRARFCLVKQTIQNIYSIVRSNTTKIIFLNFTVYITKFKSWYTSNLKGLICKTKDRKKLWFDRNYSDTIEHDRSLINLTTD